MTSNGNEMDLYIYASGRAINSRSNILMLAEDMPSTTSIKHTENWGMKIESYPNGIKSSIFIYVVTFQKIFFH